MDMLQRGKYMVSYVKEIDLKSRINPVTEKGYQSDCIIFILEENENPGMVCGKSANGIYTARTGTGNLNWKMAVGDFINYNNIMGHEAVVCISSKRLDEVKESYLGHSYNERRLREYEPSFLIHSTTYENGKRILEDGYIGSWNLLKKEKKITGETQVGKILGDLDYFSDYIMFSCGEVSSEIVVMSKQSGRIIMDINNQYKTGNRFYFDAARMAEDGIIERDGIHIKVREKLPLKPYLLWWTDWKKAGLKDQVSTPAEFTDKANSAFGNYIIYNFRRKNID